MSACFPESSFIAPTERMFARTLSITSAYRQSLFRTPCHGEGWSSCWPHGLRQQPTRSHDRNAGMRQEAPMSEPDEEKVASADRQPTPTTLTSAAQDGQRSERPKAGRCTSWSARTGPGHNRTIVARAAHHAAARRAARSLPADGRGRCVLPGQRRWRARLHRAFWKRSCAVCAR